MKFKKITAGLLGWMMLTVSLVPFTAFAISCRKDYFNKDYTLTGNMAEDVVIVAKAQKGRTGAQFGYTENWCDEFVADCLENAGADASVVGHGGTVADFEAVMRIKGAAEVSTPQTGDLIFFTKSHVEIVTRVEDGVVYCIGGNNGGTGNYKTNYSAGERKASSVGTARLYLKPNYPDNPVLETKWYDGLTPINLGESFCAFIENSTTGGYLQNEGWNVAAYAGTDTYEQTWIFNRKEDGSYAITSLFDINNMTVTDAEDANGASVVVTTDDFNDNQRWFIYDTDRGYVLRFAYSDKVMDLDGGRYDAGTNIQIYEYNETTSQYFNIKKTVWYDFLQPADLGAEFYAVSNNNTTGGYINNEGWNVAAYSGTEDKEQIWHFEKQDDGSYVINSVLDNARMSPYNAENDNGTSIIVTHDEINSAQKWYIYYTNRGYVFRPSSSEKVIDISGGGYVSGTDIQLYEFNCTYSQFFSIKEIEYSNSIFGDCNNDGELDVSDIIALKKHLMNKQNLTEAQFQTADLNQDGKVNIYDFILLKRKLIYG